MHLSKPEWLKTSLGGVDDYGKISALVATYKINTICKSGRCPNHNYCWSKGSAAFMICGDICTRSCGFCNTKTGKPLPLENSEPEKLSSLIAELNLKAVVLTSVDRDDLPDSGVEHWVRCINSIKKKCPEIKIEALIPDFRSDKSLLDKILKTDIDIIGHNVETVERLSSSVRSVASYRQSLDVLTYLSKQKKTKSGFMLGLGETESEIYETLEDLLKTGCSIVTIGQYMRPSRNNLPVEEYVKPEVFEKYKIAAEKMGFKIVESAPLVRSSFNASKYLVD